MNTRLASSNRQQWDIMKSTLMTLLTLIRMPKLFKDIGPNAILHVYFHHRYLCLKHYLATLVNQL